MKTILVTTDLSDESKVAFAQAAELAKAMGARILLVAVVEDLAQSAILSGLDFPIIPDAETQKSLVEKIKSELTTFKNTFFQAFQCDTQVIQAHGAVHSEIVSLAKEKDVAMIVLSSHGRTGLTRLLIGSVAEKVVREAGCPVLTVPVRS